jgi:predicted PurR-regulated permease PerM
VSEANTQAFQQRIIVGLLLVGILLLGYRVLHLFIVPVAWAFILVYVTWPAYQPLRKLLLGHPTGSAVLMTLILSATFALPLIWLIALLRAELPLAYQAITQYLTEERPALPEFIVGIPWAGQELERFFAKLNTERGAWQEQLTTWVSPWIDEIAQMLGGAGRNFVKFGFALVTAFFFYRDGEALLQQASQILSQIVGERTRAYLTAVADTIRAVLYGLVLTALAQGLLAGIGYWMAGVRAPVLLGALTAMLALIPFGPVLIWGVVGIGLLLTDHIFAGVGVLLWGGLVVSQVDNLIRPLVISGATRIPYLLVMFGVLGGIAAFGLIGLFLGPVVIAVLLAIWREWLEEQTQSQTSV